jgi:hypothetical protein
MQNLQVYSALAVLVILAIVLTATFGKKQMTKLHR